MSLVTFDRFAFGNNHFFFLKPRVYNKMKKVRIGRAAFEIRKTKTNVSSRFSKNARILANGITCSRIFRFRVLATTIGSVCRKSYLDRTCIRACAIVNCNFFFNLVSKIKLHKSESPARRLKFLIRKITFCLAFLRTRAYQCSNHV